MGIGGWVFVAALAAVGSGACAAEATGDAGRGCPDGADPAAYVGHVSRSATDLVRGADRLLDHASWGPPGVAAEAAIDVSREVGDGLSVGRDYVIAALAAGCLSTEGARTALRTLADDERERGRLEERARAASEATVPPKP